MNQKKIKKNKFQNRLSCSTIFHFLFWCFLGVSRNKVYLDGYRKHTVSNFYWSILLNDFNLFQNKKGFVSISLNSTTRESIHSIFSQVRQIWISLSKLFTFWLIQLDPFVLKLKVLFLLNFNLHLILKTLLSVLYFLIRFNFGFVLAEPDALAGTVNARVGRFWIWLEKKRENNLTIRRFNLQHKSDKSKTK